MKYSVACLYKVGLIVQLRLELWLFIHFVFEAVLTVLTKISQ